MMTYDLVVVGGGPAGMAAAIEAKKNGVCHVLVIERDIELGGILQQCIHNGFGLHEFKEELTGPEYAERFIDELLELDIDYKVDTMVMSISEDKIINAINPIDGYMKICGKAIVLAMGCRERTRGSVNIGGTRPAGIYTAGLAQRFINIEGLMIGKKVMIIGSGDIGLIMARRLTLEGAQVIAVTARNPYAGGLTRNVVQCLDDFKIPILLSHNIIEIIGKDRVEAVKIAKVDSNKQPILDSAKVYDCDTVLFSIGLIPENELSREMGILIDDKTGGPIVNEYMETSMAGVFACGNVVHVHDVVDYVTEESRKAGLGVAKYIDKSLKSCEQVIRTIPKNGIKYIIPQSICLENIGESIELLMRSDSIYENVDILIADRDRILKRIRKKNILPAEMEIIKVEKEFLRANNVQEISIYIEEVLFDDRA